MRSKQLNLTLYETDKVKHGYLNTYDLVLEPWVNKEIRLLEIGVRSGGSLRLWRDYFPRGTIIGIDRSLPRNFVPGERIFIFQGDQSDTRFLSQVANKIAPEGFDIIIDDASHIGELTKIAFWHLFEHHLKPGGLYAIEDWGTGYRNNFPDGKQFRTTPPVLHRVRSALRRASGGTMKVPFPCHAYGMVGFVKELIDEQGAASITMQSPAGKRRASRFQSVHVTDGIVFVTKIPPVSMNASPNPVPTGDKAPGSTTISWSTGSADIGCVYVSVDGGRETLFAQRNHGSAIADWIKAGCAYEFRLYDSGHTKLLASVRVTGAQI
ncbi:MAG TPA: hypothetical protein VFA85_13920 [Terriglobales bacterium]|jgi:hypothetical protein|nr:hypothetical protein [Terriglobales bacterium]